MRRRKASPAAKHSEPPPRLAVPSDLAGIDVPEVDLVDPDPVWLTLGRSHRTAGGETDLPAVVTRLRALGCAALHSARALEVAAGQGRPTADLLGRAADLLDAAGDALAVHDARRAVELRAKVTMPEFLEAVARLTAATAHVTRIKAALVDQEIATARAFDKDPDGVHARALAWLEAQAAATAGTPDAFPPDWRELVVPPARLRALLGESPSRTARDHLGRELGLGATSFRELEGLLAALRALGWAPTAWGGRLVVAPALTGRRRR